MATRPNRSDLACFALYGLILALFLLPRYLAGGTLYFSMPHERSGLEIHVAFQLANGALWGEGVPLWNPWSGCGTPHLANLQSAVFFPLHALFLVLPPIPAAEVLLVLRLFLAAVFAGGFARSLGLSRPAAVFLAVAYACNAWQLRFANNAYGNGVFLLPLTCQVFLRLGELGRRRELLAAVLLVALHVLAGLPESAAFNLAAASLCFGFGSHRALQRGPRPGASVPGTRGRRALALLIALAGGVLLSAAQVLPFLEYLRHSWSTHLGAVDFRERAAPLEAAFGAAFPFTDESLPLEATVLSPGVVVLAFAALGVQGRVLGGFEPWLGVFALVAGLKLFGVPPVHWIGRLPGLETLNFPLYLPPSVHLALATLGAAGFERWACTPATAGGRRRMRITLAAVGLGLVAAWWFAPQTGWRHGYSLAGLAVVAATVALGSLNPRSPRVLGPRAGVSGVLILLVAELWLHDTRIPIETTPFEASYEQPMREGGGALGRFLQGELGPDERLMVTGRPLPNAQLAWGPVRGFGYKDAIRVERFWSFALDTPDPGAAEDKTPASLDRRLLDLAAVGLLVHRGEERSWAATNLMRRVEDRGLRAFEGPAGHAIVPIRERDREPAVLARAPFEARLRHCALGSFERLSFFYGAEEPVGETLRITLEVLARERRWPLFRAELEAGAEGWRSASVALPVGVRRGGLVVRVEGESGAATEQRVGFGGLRLLRRAELDTRALEPLASFPSARVYRRSSALPRARIVHGAVVAGTDVTGELLDPGFDPRRAVVLEEPLPTPLSGSQARSPARIVESRPRRLVVEVEPAARGLLVVADTYFPGWKARVDGVERPILPANLAFRAIPVEPGDRVVELVYDPLSFRLGALVSLVSLALWVFAALRTWSARP